MIGTMYDLIVDTTEISATTSYPMTQSLTQVVAYALSAEWVVGTATGTIEVEVSTNNETWHSIKSQDVTAAAKIIVFESDVAYRWVRVRFVRTTGTLTSLKADISGKG